ncbi:unnamed protein product [Mytilus edulis]|uniref:Tesmin/TSO1-like CXC domain-containing protein n=1 Tax=Mytilus edulis TaxID=6550 RepID=A0A8S3RGJ5_MYTED|nr:unnamed protein product [Mytilus edulis]
MQASRPRALITPLQLGLGVQVHHNFASRFLVSTLNSLGFCSSYYEVQKFESSAAAVQGVDLPGDISNSFVQFVADNVDHNTRTIDGLNTFHGMGIIAGITPGTKRTQPIPRIAFSTDEIKALAKIEIKYYKPQSDRMAELSYAELKNLNTLDKTFRLDLLSVIIWPLKYPIPMWSGFMQMVQTGDYPGKSSVSFLPMIDLNASDMTCIYSTLNFVANQAKRYDITAILTFDQPLYWKALSIVENENPGSTLKSMVLRLGPFHTEMSFLGSIGNLMSNTGLKEMLELIYAPNAVTHILSGKAVARAFRGHMLVDTALYCLLIADIFNIDVSKLLEEPNSTLETTEMKEIDELYSQLSSGELSASEAGESDVLKNLEATVRRKTEILKQSRTAKLWLQYSEMVQVLRQFIKAERTGNWPLHLQSIQEMLPFLAASGHNLYTKTAYVYLMTMQSLDEDHPDVYASFINGNHVIRRSNRYWAGISSDLFIEQVLMRSVKTAGELTRGRGMTESQRSLWLMSMPACAEINQAMQDLSGVGYFSKVDRSLRNIETGVVADKTVNVDDAKKVGTSILQELVGKNIADHTFRRKKQAITLGNKVQAKLDGEPLRIDSQLLFQRCTTAAHGIFEDISEIFQFELCGVPSSIFETTGLPREPQKSTLAEYMWNLTGLKPKAPTETHFVLDGGSLIHRLPWTKGATVDTICMTYVNYVNNHYTDATVVFDGYPSVPTTKDVTHFRRTKGILSPKVNFNNDTPIKTKKDEFLSNSENKQHFINTLGEKLKDGHVQVIHAEDDADLKIVLTAIEKSKQHTTTVIGEDTDLLILLCYHSKDAINKIYFQIRSQAKHSQNKDLGHNRDKEKNWTTCKGTVFKKISTNIKLQDHAAVFCQESNVESIHKAGEQIFVALYGGLQDVETLDMLRYRIFASKVCVGNIYVQVHTLPPTSDAAKLHCIRVYHQTQVWIGKGDKLDPKDWGWHVEDNKLLPIRALLPPAPEKLLRIIRCNCKLNCDTKRCSCRKHGIDCSPACGECRGMNCSNTSNITEADELDDR